MGLNKVERQFLLGCGAVLALVLTLAAFLVSYPFYTSISGREDILFITVLSEEGMPVEGATFRSPNLIQATVTDADGNATLRISRSIFQQDAFIKSQLKVESVALLIEHKNFQSRSLLLPGMNWTPMTAELHWTCLSSASSEIEVRLDAL